MSDSNLGVFCYNRVMKNFRKILLLALSVFLCIEWGVLTPERAKYGIACGDFFVKEIVLTFDDGPRESGTQEILEVLNKYNVKATFFVVGKFADRYSQFTKLLHESGQEIANHSFTHPRLYKLWVEKIMREAERCDEVLESLNIPKTRFLRPPGGGFNIKIFNAMRRMNLKLGLWNINTADYTDRPKSEIVNLVLKSAKPGAIILMHNGMPNTVEALPEIIEGLHAKGYTFVRLRDLWDHGMI